MASMDKGNVISLLFCSCFDNFPVDMCAYAQAVVAHYISCFMVSLSIFLFSVYYIKIKVMCQL